MTFYIVSALTHDLDVFQEGLGLALTRETSTLGGSQETEGSQRAERLEGEGELL